MVSPYASSSWFFDGDSIKGANNLAWYLLNS
jgi:hypothetical protein